MAVATERCFLYPSDKTRILLFISQKRMRVSFPDIFMSKRINFLQSNPVWRSIAHATNDDAVLHTPPVGPRS